jgi:hypothetical protein
MIASLAALTGPVGDPDFWWHVRTGAYIAQHGLPAHDLYTYTASSHVWTDHEWLTELLMSWVFAATGFVGIAIAFGLITWAGLWLLFRSARAERQPLVVAGLGLALAVAAGGPIWGPRAQMITFLFSCLELHWIRGYLSGRSRMLLWFPLLMVLWANLHGGWAIGFAFLGIAFAAEAVRYLLDRQDLAARAHLKRLAIVGVLSVAAVAATPHGLSLYLYPFQTVGSAAQERLIVEWFSPDFHRADLKPFEAMLLLLFVGFALKRPSLYDLLLTLAAVALSLQSVRNVVLFIAATTPILINTWSAIWREVAARRGWRLGNIPQTPVISATTAVALLVIAAASAFQVTAHLETQDKVVRDAFPVGAADWLQQHPEVGTRMFNQYGYGGYLAYRFYPDPNRRVFIFGEAALMGDALLNRYEDVAALKASWLKVLDGEGVDYVVFNRDAPLTDVLATEPGWRLAYQDGTAVIYVRSGPTT